MRTSDLCNLRMYLGIIHLVRAQDFPKNLHSLPPNQKMIP